MSIKRPASAGFPRDRGGIVRNQRVTDILKSVVYVGYVDSKNWNVSLRKRQLEKI